MATSAELLKRAEKAGAEGQWIDAATLFERGGDLERAIAAYTKGGGVDRAAWLLEQTGRGPQAAALLSSCGQHLKAAALHEKAKDYRRAAAALMRANERERAAAVYERGEAWEDAAKIYASLGNHGRAIQLYELAGLADKVVELRAAHAGAEAAAAEEVLELDPSMEIAADQYLDSGTLTDSMVALLRRGRVDDAARLYGNCQEDLGYGVLAAVAGDREVELKAAEMFVAAKDYAKAGQVFENLERWADAGAMFERADDAYMAAEMYVRAGDRLKAAEMFEKNSSWQQAAELYLAVEAWDKAAVNFERSVNHFVAGKLYFRMKRMDKSLQLLQKVQKSEQQYFEACRLIGEILATHGHLDLAIRKYLEVCQAAELGKETAAVFYNLGRALEQRGNVQQAAQIYRRLLTFDFSFLDVGARLKALQAAPPPAAAPPLPTTPPPGASPAAPSLAAGAGQPGAPARAPGRATQLVMMMDGFDFLKGTPLFKELALDEMKAVYQACEIRRFKAGEVLIEQDQPGAALFVLRKGTARVLRRSGAKEEAMARMGPGSPAGEMALVDDAPTSARVVAEVDVEAFCITRERFQKLLALNDRMAVKLHRFFVATLARRLRSTSERLAGKA
ncbi:MAG: cyclic nucleotide-binding domain-containing protein [Anaeromyxobacter sp.]|nr:cyclic nucleotide-binding domain-containing protein [Anaeromyxobacter sp.]